MSFPLATWQFSLPINRLLGHPLTFFTSLFIGTVFALIGGALQAATQSSDFILVARVITGVGADLEISQLYPLTYRVAQAASGKALDMSVVVEFDVERV